MLAGVEWQRRPRCVALPERVFACWRAKVGALGHARSSRQQRRHVQGAARRPGWCVCARGVCAIHAMRLAVRAGRGRGHGGRERCGSGFTARLRRRRNRAKLESWAVACACRCPHGLVVVVAASGATTPCYVRALGKAGVDGQANNSKDRKGRPWVLTSGARRGQASLTPAECVRRRDAIWPSGSRDTAPAATRFGA